MESDRSHLQLSMASTLASGAGSQQQQPPTQPHQQPPAPSGHATDGQETSPAPTKRGPGRPKGSTKKTLEIDPSSPPKVKRPVGRPRKDGRPAGSVPKVARGPGRPRKNFPPDFAVNTFSQQHQTQQNNGDQQEWPPVSTIPSQNAIVHGIADDRQLQGMFNNYRLPKEGTSDPSAAPGVDNSSSGDRTSGSSAAQDTTSNVPQNAKWFPPATAASTSNAPAASSSSIANALIHPPSMNQNAGPSHLADSMVATSSALGLAGNRDQHVNNNNSVYTGTRAFGEVSSSVPMAQIPDFILSTIYSLFSRPSTTGLPLPRDVLTTYRAHLAHLSGSHSMAYNILKTFWLPYSPLLFRLVLPRTAPASKSAHRNSSVSHKPSSSLNSNFMSHSNHTTVNGDGQNANRTPGPAEQNYDSHRFFYWDPFHLSLGGPLTCPVCQQAPLTHCGPIRTGPLRVFDLPSSSAPSASAHANAGLVPAAFYVIGMQYGCQQMGCGVKLNSWDSRIVNNLPQVLADEWPVHMASVSSDTEQTDSRGARWSGDAVSRPLYTLAKSLLQAGTPQQGVRDILAKLWNWNDGERDEEHEDDEGPEEVVEMPTANQSDKDKVAVAEALFANPYHRLWTAQTAQTQEPEAPVSAPSVNGQRPAKRQKTNEVAQGVPTVVSATAPSYLSRPYAPHSSATGDSGSTGVALQVQPPQDQHRPNGTGVDNRSPRIQPQPQPQSQVRHQPSQSQLKPNPPARPQPSPRTTITHTHAPHIHTPSPIYPSISLPNSTTNSPQTGNGAPLNLKRPLEPESHHPNSAGGPSVTSAPAPTSAQTSPAQPQFPGIGHNSPYTHLRPLQQHPAHPSQQPLPQHHQPHQSHQSSQPVRPGPPLHMHHPSLGLTSSALARFNTQSALQQHQSLLGAAPQPQPPQPQPQPPQHTPQRRVRHCVKCGRHECKGKGGSQFCKNTCKDCGSMDCRGRNSKRPNATCREGW